MLNLSGKKTADRDACRYVMVSIHFNVSST